MKKGVLVFMLLALGLTGGTIFFVNKWLKGQRDKQAELAKKQQAAPAQPGLFVLVASKALPAGTFVAAGDLQWQSWPDRAVRREYVTRQPGSPEAVPTSMIGTVVRHGVIAGAPITNENIIKPGDRGFLAAVLRPDMRAVSVRVDEATGVSGLVFPGDRVDVILLYEFQPLDGAPTQNVRAQRRISETILTGVRVIAIDQAMEDLKGKGPPKAARTVTLEVSPRQAEIVQLATRMGTLTLSLQSLACKDDVAPGNAANTGERATANGTDTAANEASNCAAQRPAEAERGKTYTMDTDVSRAVMPPTKSESQEIVVIRGSKIDVQTESGKVLSSHGSNAPSGSPAAPASPTVPANPTAPGAKK